MGKASRWFRSLLGLKSSSSSADSHNKNKKQRKWSFVKSFKEKQPQNNTNTNVKLLNNDSEDDPNKHAIAVAAATAAAAEAAVAAAHAAAAVVRLTSGSGRRCENYNNRVRQDLAAVKIQSSFRGYLARRALRALKGLVRLQALVRGHIVRKRTTEWVQQMQALIRAQARARAGRFQVLDSPISSGKSSHLSHPGPATPEKFEYTMQARSINYDQPYLFKRNCSNPYGRTIDDQDRTHSSWNWSDGKSSDYHQSVKMCSLDEQKDDKILEVDSGRSYSVPKQKNSVPFKQQSLIRDQDSLNLSKDSTAHLSVPSSYSCEVQSLSQFNFSNEVNESPFCTATNSPQIFSASSKGGSLRRSPFTPTRSDGPRSYLSGYSDCPSYMAYTECSRAKVRSLSAPKQRPHYERSSSTKRHSIHGFAETKSTADKISSLHTSFTSKHYPGSGRLDRLGMPVRGDGLGYRY